MANVLKRVKINSFVVKRKRVVSVLSPRIKIMWKVTFVGVGRRRSQNNALVWLQALYCFLLPSSRPSHIAFVSLGS